MSATPRVLAILRAHHDTLVDNFAARIVQRVPSYMRFAGPDFRQRIDALVRDMLDLIETEDPRPLLARLRSVSQQRAAQGLAASDFFQAVLQCFPAMREMVRFAGPGQDATFAKEFDRFEAMVGEYTALAANAFMEATAGQLREKNLALNRLNQALANREGSLRRELDDVSRRLEDAESMAQRVIDGLFAGIMVVEASERRITLYSSRLEEITGIPAQDALGRTVEEVFGEVRGFDLGRVVETVEISGQLPLTRVHVGLPTGERSVLVRATQLYDREGDPSTTVVIVDDVTERELLMESVSRYVSRDALSRILARGQLALEAERRECAILFADIRGFSGLAEDLAPEALHELLNDYFRVMIRGIDTSGGFIDKFVGDEIMAIFSGASPADAALAATLAARRIKTDIAALNARRVETAIDVGIGVSTGEVLLGNVGDETRMNFTALGDVVNVADRLQGLARQGEVLVCANTAGYLGADTELVDRGETVLRGRRSPVHVFELVLSRK